MPIRSLRSAAPMSTRVVSRRDTVLFGSSVRSAMSETPAGPEASACRTANARSTDWTLDKSDQLPDEHPVKRATIATWPSAAFARMRTWSAQPCSDRGANLLVEPSDMCLDEVGGLDGAAGPERVVDARVLVDRIVHVGHLRQIHVPQPVGLGVEHVEGVGQEAVARSAPDDLVA